MNGVVNPYPRPIENCGGPECRVNIGVITRELHRHNALLTAGWQRRSSPYRFPNAAPCFSYRNRTDPIGFALGSPRLTARTIPPLPACASLVSKPRLADGLRDLAKPRGRCGGTGS